jgi:hypothetical protein
MGETAVRIWLGEDEANLSANTKAWALSRVRESRLREA